MILLTFGTKKKKRKKERKENDANELNCKAETDSQTQKTNLWSPKGQGDGGHPEGQIGSLDLAYIYTHTHTYIYILLYIK